MTNVFELILLYFSGTYLSLREAFGGAGGRGEEKLRNISSTTSENVRLLHALLCGCYGYMFNGGGAIFLLLDCMEYVLLFFRFLLCFF